MAFMCLLQTPSPDALLDELAKVASGMTALARDFGMSPKMLSSKTEAALALAGEEQRPARQRVAERPKDEDTGAAHLHIPGSASLRVVDEYRHLGCQITARATACSKASVAHHTHTHS